MNISLTKALITDISLIHSMQIKSFKYLLEKYNDIETNPGAETKEIIVKKFLQTNTNYFLIKSDSEIVGAIRIVSLENKELCRISPIFILPEHQNKGIAQIVFQEIEKIFKPQKGWILETINEEKGNCHLYEKVGYRKTGNIDKIKEGMNLVHYKKEK